MELRVLDSPLSLETAVRKRTPDIGPKQSKGPEEGRGRHFQGIHEEFPGRVL